MKNINIEVFLESLTKKQLEVLCCLIFGLSYKSIGKLLGISDRTVGVHIHEILQKAGASTKDEIIKLFNLPENIRYYEKLKNKYNVISGRIPQKHSLFLRMKYMVFCCSIALLLGATLYYHLNRAEISLQSIGNSSYLLERNNLIEQMNSNPGIIILKGQGGAGKTTLAREYLKNIGASVKYEINTETKTSFKAELSGLARVLSKNPKDLENKSILDSITDEHERLRHLSIFLFNLLKKEKSWCLLLDNLDNLTLISLMYLDNFLQLQNGTIVITTRNKDVDSYFPKAKIISIEKLSEKEKQKLFYKITKLPSSKIIEENLQKIPSYPLDVSCCAYYIKNTGISLPTYIQQMEKMDYAFWKGNQKILTENANYDKSRYNIVISSIENILQQNTAITKALFAVSVFDSQKIPVSLLTKIIGEQLYYESIHNFRKYGLLEINNDNTIALHRTAQLILRHYCFQNVSQTNLLKFATKICDAILSEKEKEELIPHVKAILNNLKDILPLSYKTEMRKFLIKLIQNYGCPAIGAVKYIREITQTKNATLSL